MTTNALPEAPTAPTDDWAAAMASLRARFPKATDGILFCIHKLEQNSTLTIPDFRDEAKLHGIALGGRALHSAKVLLGLASAKPSRRNDAKTARKGDTAKWDAAKEDRAKTPARRARRSDPRSLTDQVVDAITQIQNSATEENQRLRAAMREAVRILDEALGED